MAGRITSGLTAQVHQVGQRCARVAGAGMQLAELYMPLWEKKKKKISSPADRKQAALTATRRGNISPARNARSGTVTEKSSHFVCSHKVQRYRAALKMCEFICGFMLLLEGTTQVFRPGGSTVSTRYIHWNAANASTEKPSFPYV